MNATGRITQPAKTQVRVLKRMGTLPPVFTGAGSLGSSAGNQGGVRQTQQMLRGHGYTIAVDGVMGPQTRSALDALKRGVAPGVWARGSRPAPAARPAPAPVRRGPTHPIPRAGNVRLGPAPRVPVPGPPGAAAGPSAPPTPGVAGDPNALDPNDPVTYATAMINSQYGPQIAELSRQMATQMAAAQAAQQSIGSWYDKLGAQVKDSAAADTTQLNDLLAGTDSAGAGALNALGGGASDAAGSAAAFQAIERGDIANTGQIMHNYDTRMGPIVGLQGADSQRAQLASDRSASEELASKMSDLYAARGSDFVKAVGDAQDRALQNKVAEENAAAQKALMPSQLASAKLGLAGKRLSLKQQQAALRSQALSDKIARTKLKLAIQKQGADGTQAAVPAWQKLDPGKLSGLRDELLSGVVSKQNPSKLKVDPMVVYNQWGNTLRGVSNGTWDPRQDSSIRSWRDQLLSSYLPGWNNNHPNLRYAIRNGVLVRLPNLGRKKAK